MTWTARRTLEYLDGWHRLASAGRADRRSARLFCKLAGNALAGALEAWRVPPPEPPGRRDPIPAAVAALESFRGKAGQQRAQLGALRTVLEALAEEHDAALSAWLVEHFAAVRATLEGLKVS